MGSTQLRAEVEAMGAKFNSWQIASSLISMLLLVITALGYLSQSRVLGYWLGSALALGSVVMGFVAMGLYGHVLLQIPGLLYWSVVFALLNTSYRKAFR